MRGALPAVCCRCQAVCCHSRKKKKKLPPVKLVERGRRHHSFFELRNLPNSCYRPQSSSASALPLAGASGFFILSQSGERPER
jgi:hypothetical protein